jgi:hypothetical protein
MADVVLQEAMKDRSFAGLFPYANNTPQKVFAGQEPYVPVAVVVDALDELQSGGGGGGYATGGSMQQAASMQLQACHLKCKQVHESCMQQSGSAPQCVQQAKACFMQCQ